jgi:two-component system nitrogen regulation response regulator NtrX
MRRILLIDDQENYCEQVQKALALYQYPLEYETDAVEGLHRATFEDWDVLLLDVVLNQDLNGLDILKQVVEKKPKLPIVMISGASTLRTAVDATKIGAYDFLEKPLDVSRLLLTIRRAFEKNQLTQANQALLNELSKEKPLVGVSHAMQNILGDIERFAPSDAKVFIHGESGTGKDLVAKIIHFRSPHKAGPFVAINCSAIPEQLIESELFGHEKGAFTGADEKKHGLIAKAQDGTLFLDEITELPLLSQAKLLRFLQDGSFNMLGSTKTITSNARIISATNKDIKSEIANGNFREDLYYRLNVVNLYIPPIRERREDIVPLSEFFLRNASNKCGRKITHFSEDALNIIKNANWPGNIRQLKSAISRMVVFSENNVIDYGTAATALQMDRTLDFEVLTDNYNLALKEFEKLYFFNILRLNNWNLKKTSEHSGLDEDVLLEKLNSLSLLEDETIITT